MTPNTNTTTSPQIITSPGEMQAFALACRREGKTIGLVPTMGFLHPGHRSLMERSVRENDITVVSIFVNPTQFGPEEDFEVYPRDLEHDCAVVQAAGAQVIFHPAPEDMYPAGYQSFVEVTDITQTLCGKSRPTHFRGVTTVVCKLFHITLAHRAYFGQKDAQQLAVIMRMTEDMNLPVTIVPCPIVREPDGLAMSSRNTYLTSDQRREALALSRSLNRARQAYDRGERSAQVLKNQIVQGISVSPLADIDYVEAVSFPGLLPVDTLRDQTLIAVAVRFGNTRLIDNILLGGEVL